MCLPRPLALQRRATSGLALAALAWATQLFPAFHTAFHRPDHVHRGGAVLPAGWAEAARAEAHEHPHRHGHGHEHRHDHAPRPAGSPEHDHGRGSFAHFAAALPAVEAVFVVDIETVAVEAPPCLRASAPQTFAVVVPPPRGPPSLLPA